MVESRTDFEAFYRANHGGSLQLAEVSLGSTAAAEEIVQDAFVMVWQRWERLQNPRAYLLAAIRNRCRSEHRSEAVRRRALPKLAAATVESLPGPDYLDDVLEALPNQQQRVVWLRIVGGWSIDQAADVLGTAPGTVKSSTHRGLATLRQALEPAA